MEKITEWVLINLDAPQHKRKPLLASDSQHKLNELKTLIEPFLDGKSAGLIPKHVTIVWSLTGSLYRVPIHGIFTGDELFIHRNPVIYTQSLGLLYQIWKKRRIAKPEVSAKMAVINPLASDWTSSVAAKEIVTSLSRFQALHGTDITKTQAMQLLQGCHVFNFQGHARFEASDPMSSFLRLGGKRERITVRDILRELKLDSLALCIFFACGSGKPTITTADDVLSLPIALHYAGASSIVSTLWPVDDTDGAVFVQRFYKELVDASPLVEQASSAKDLNDGPASQRSTGLVNLAKVMQSTIVGIYNEATNEEEKLPYH